MKHGEASKTVFNAVKKGMNNQDILALLPDSKPETIIEKARLYRKKLGLPNAKSCPRGPSIKLPNSIYAHMKQEAEARGVEPYDLVRSVLAAVVAQNKIADLLDRKGERDA